MATPRDRSGVCGVYCGQCPSGNGRVQLMAGELKRLVDTGRYEWMREAVSAFAFDEFRKGLEWFARAHCPMCRQGGGAPCANRPCAQAKSLDSCLLCDEYPTCAHTTYHREWYPFVLEHYKRVAQVGLPQHLDEEEARAQAGIDVMGHLERRCCKVVPLET